MKPIAGYFITGGGFVGISTPAGTTDEEVKNHLKTEVSPVNLYPRRGMVDQISPLQSAGRHGRLAIMDDLFEG
jgi:hypothetical protein